MLHFYVNVLPGNGDGTFLPGNVYDGIYPCKVDLGDFNNDGRLDVAHDGGSDLSVYLGNGDGTLQTAQRSYVAAWSFAHGVGDLNGDGNLDLLMQDGTANAVVPVLGNGDGTFRPTEAIFLGTIHDAAVGHVNADHKLDKVSVDSNYDEYGVVWTSSARVLLGRGDGTFSPPVTSDLATSVGNYVGSLLLADFDGDGGPDLAGAASDSLENTQGLVAVAHNDGIWTPPPPPLPSLTISDATVT